MIFLTILAVSVQMQAADYPYVPVPFSQVKVEDEFWAPRIETNRTTTIPFAFRMNEQTGRMDNFRIAAGLMKGTYRGKRYNDTDVYKVIEGAAYSLRQHPDAELEKYVDGLIEIIAKAQEPDGYLFTARTCDPNNPAPGAGPERWSLLAVSHELYSAGHMYEAAVAYFQATGKRTLLDVAIKNADLLDRTFGSGPGQRAGTSGHQEIEIGLVKLYCVTRDEKYLKLARYFLDVRGRIENFMPHYPADSPWSVYNDPVQIQAHKPILDQDEAVGHAVRAAYMFSGIADVAALTGNEAYLRAIDRLWSDVVGRKVYLTGGIGAVHSHESFGKAYELPNLTAYNETCAAIGNVFWNHRLFLLHGDAKYLDVLERTAYNGLISGVSLSGDRFFYPNPLSSDGKFRFNQGATARSPWFEVACCPGNVARFLPSFSGYIYAHRGDTLYVNLFVAGRGDVDLDGRRVIVRQQTRYPWEGIVRIVLEPRANREFTVAVRIPGWARGEAMPGGLYRFLDSSDATPILRINGVETPLNVADDFARVRRVWTDGDTIELNLPMPVRRIVADERIEADLGRVALQRGPLVYCVEGCDQPGKRVANLLLPDDVTLQSQWRSDLPGGLMAITGRVQALQEDGSLRDQDFVAIPCYAWAHRGAGEMAVWLARNRKALDRVEQADFEPEQ
ncbi:MAG: glycoside hydrolase family 127 protein [Solirubrobacterales bacterium]